jgi:hypothetical protein
MKHSATVTRCDKAGLCLGESLVEPARTPENRRGGTAPLRYR